MIKYFIFFIVFIFIVALVIFLFMKFKKVKNIKKHVIKTRKNYEIKSIGDLLYQLFYSLLKGLSFMLKKSRFLNKTSKKYEEFLRLLNGNFEAIDIITIKLFSAVGLLFIIVTLYALLSFNSVSMPILIILIIGYYLPNIYLFVARRINRYKISSEIKNTITLWNNAYKSGKSTLQAIETIIPASPLFMAIELRLLKQDLEGGLEITESFDRFEKRTGVEKVRYITEIISISEATGGNIVNLFTRLEQSLLTEEKIKNEKEALAAASKMTASILLILPMVFYLVIMFLAPDYFDPLFNTVVGLGVLATLGILYLIYIVIVIKIFKVSR